LPQTFETWIHGRVTACAALGKGGEEMARGWALSDLASHIGDAEQLLLAELVEAHRWKGASVTCDAPFGCPSWSGTHQGRAGRENISLFTLLRLGILGI
jgi:phytoene synthase